MVSEVLYRADSLNPPDSPKVGHCCYHPHLINEETEARVVKSPAQGYMTIKRSLRPTVALITTTHTSFSLVGMQHRDTPWHTAGTQ